MRNRCCMSAADEGGRCARPRSLLRRMMLAAAVACLLVTAVQETVSEPEADDLPREHAVNEAGVRQVDWATLPEVIVAWVEVPGTNIDEPIAQALPESPDRFLYHDALGQGSYGTPYVDCDCAVDSPFAVVYGHHMSDGTVFADFAKFSDRDYAQEHEVIYVYTRSDNKRHELKVEAVDVVNANRETLRTSFGTDEERDAYLNDSIAKSDLVLDGDSLTGEKIWAFATCSYQTSNSRTVVYASVPQSTS